MLFKFGKCKCLHTGHGNEDAQHTIGGTVLNTTLKENHVGLTRNQSSVELQQGIQIIGLFTRSSVVYKENELIIPLYKTIVRPHLESSRTMLIC